MKKRVCFCINSLKIGGAESLLINIINNWNTTEWEISLCLLNSKNDYKEKIKFSNIKNHITIQSDNKAFIILNAFRFCRNNKIDIVNTHLEKSNIWFAIGAFISGAKVVSTVHSTNFFNEISFLRAICYKFIYNLVPTKIVCVSSAVKKYLIESRIKKDLVKVIYNGVDIEYISRKYPKIIKDNDLKIAYIGRLEYQKGVDILLDALAMLSEANIAWKLDIIGDGSEKSFLIDKANNLGILSGINFLGMQKEPLAYIPDKSILCMPSRREGLPIALLEAMAMGLPVIVSNVGFMPELVHDGYNGYVFQKESPSDLAEKIIMFTQLCIKDIEKFSENAKDTANKYDIENCVKGYEKLFLEIIG